DSEACGIGWKPFRDSCYKMITSGKTWRQGFEHCKSAGSQLVKVTDKKELTYIYFTFVKPLNSGSAWMGLSLKNGSFYWTDGSKPGYKNWNYGEPNNFNGREHCVEIYVNNGKWNDIPCFVKRPFVCERVPLQSHPRNHMSASLGNVNHALANCSLEEHYVADITDCFQRCLAITRCLSFNIENSGKHLKKCELNNSTRAWAREKFVKRLGYIYYD
ncbi:unnamed protein product, partial [Porites evermanni]